MLFEQAQTGSHNIAGRTITTCLNLGVNKAGEVIAERHRCILGHDAPPKKIIYQLLVFIKDTHLLK
jgi:hypothetical protein